jgi:hypothetical protein
MNTGPDFEHVITYINTPRHMNMVDTSFPCESDRASYLLI